MQIVVFSLIIGSGIALWKALSNIFESQEPRHNPVLKELDRRSRSNAAAKAYDRRAAKLAAENATVADTNAREANANARFHQPREDPWIDQVREDAVNGQPRRETEEARIAKQ